MTTGTFLGIYFAIAFFFAILFTYLARDKDRDPTEAVISAAICTIAAIVWPFSLTVCIALRVVYGRPMVDAVRKENR